MASASVRRGEVYLTDLSASGGRLRKRRPVVVIQNDVANRWSNETIVAAIRDAASRRTIPVMVPVARGSAGLHKDSVVDAGHLLTVLKEDLSRPLGMLPAEVMANVNRALKKSLALD